MKLRGVNLLKDPCRLDRTTTEKKTSALEQGLFSWAKGSYQGDAGSENGARREARGLRPDLGSATSVLEFRLRKNSETSLKL